MFCAAFSANLSHSLSYEPFFFLFFFLIFSSNRNFVVVDCKINTVIDYRKFPICFVLHFLANMSKMLSYYYVGNFLYILLRCFWLF